MSVLTFPKRKRNLRRKHNGKYGSENNPLGSKEDITSAKRALFECSAKRPKLTVDCENLERQTEKPGENFTPNQRNVKLTQQDTSVYQSAKRVFHTSISCRLIGREKEIDEITRFITRHVSERKPGSLYISGAPGTGKTSCLMHILNKVQEKHRVVFINSMTMSNPSSVYSRIVDELQLPVPSTSPTNILSCIEKYLVNSEKMHVLVFDEIDQLDSKGQEILYSLFEWPQLPNSSVIMIGIANALDLTDRVLPRLQTFKYEPTLIHFQPYTRAQITSIIEDRLSQVQQCSSIMTTNAVQMCARKIASCTGDVRKALDVCRRAIELAEKQSRQQMVLTTSDDDRRNPGSPQKRVYCMKPVDLQQVNAVLHEVYGSRLQVMNSGSAKEIVTLPFQQVMMLCAVALVKKHCKDKDMNLGKVYDVYRRICKKRQMAFVGESEFHFICQLVESRGFIQLKNSKVPRMRKILLKVEEGELEHVLQDKSLLTSILSDSSALSDKCCR